MRWINLERNSMVGELKTSDEETASRTGGRQGHDRKNIQDHWESQHLLLQQEQTPACIDGPRRALLCFFKSGHIWRTGFCLECHIFQRPLTWKHSEEIDESGEMNEKHAMRGRIEGSVIKETRKVDECVITFFSVWVDLSWHREIKENLRFRRFHMDEGSERYLGKPEGLI